MILGNRTSNKKAIQLRGAAMRPRTITITLIEMLVLVLMLLGALIDMQHGMLAAKGRGWLLGLVYVGGGALVLAALGLLVFWRAR